MTKINVHDSSSKLAAALAEALIKLQNEALANGPSFNVAVSGGSLIKVLRTALNERSDVEWSKWKIFFADERIVPLDDKDSNYGGLRQELLDHIASSKGAPQVYTLDDKIPFTEDSSVFAQGYQKVLVEQLGSKAVLDVILLGCGPDGHTCSLFPGHKLLNEETLLVASLDDSPKPPPKRITLTKPVLRVAKKIIFVAEGAGKAPVLKEIFDNNLDYPSAQVNALSPNVEWYVDTAAVKDAKI